MRSLRSASLFTAAILLLAGCGSPGASTPVPTESAVTPVPVQTATPTGTPIFRVGQVTDLGGIDDKSFNALAWAGAQQAVKDLGVEAKYAESQSAADYPGNIQRFLDEGDNLIITVGYLLAVDNALAEKAYT